MHTAEEAREWLHTYHHPNELAHFGVLGMKWGVRKDQSSGSRETPSSSSRKSRAIERKAAIERNRVREDALNEEYQKIRKTKDRVKRRELLDAYAVKEAAVINHPDARIAANHEFKKAAIGIGILAIAQYSIKRGATYLAENPEILSRASRLMKNQKAIDKGYDVVQMVLKNGSFVLKR